MQYVAKRLAFAFVTIFVAVTLNFILFHAAPGDTVTRLIRVPGLTADAQEGLRREFGLDRPLLDQYVAYLTQTAQGNFGISFENRRPVIENLRQAYMNTVPMVFVGTLLAIVTGTILGSLAAWKRGTAIDRTSVTAALVFYSLPTQWLALVFIILFGAILPTHGMSDPFALSSHPIDAAVDAAKHMILPSTTLALVLLGQYTLVVRSSMVGTLSEDYILTARAKGLSDVTILRRYAFRNSMLPVTTLIALSLGYVVAGSILIETVFSWPGIGSAMYSAVLARDYPTLQAGFMILTISVVFANFVADLLYARLDPRVTA